MALVNMNMDNDSSLLKREVEDLRVIVHAMWRLMREQGLTDKDLNKSIYEAVAASSHAAYELNLARFCPKCQMKMQQSFTGSSARCPYCQHEVYQHPFAKYNSFDKDYEGVPEANLAYDPVTGEEVSLDKNDGRDDDEIFFERI